METCNITDIGRSCCGCGACASKCRRHAITLEEDSEGFLRPKVCASKCENCGLCRKSCPVSGEGFQPQRSRPLCFAVQADTDTRLKSSSGGVFSVIAESFLKNGGYVCGAAFTEKFSVRHRIISDLAALPALQKSKYVQSETYEVFTQLLSLLKTGKDVFFCGTPCQVAGLYSFLGKDWKNLLTAEIFCHGTPSPDIWLRYLTEEFGGPEKVSTVNFRDKTKPYNWNNYGFTITTRNQESKTCSFASDPYFKVFLKNICLRPSCYDCSFKTFPRIADISLGDFWGFRTHNKKLKKTAKEGISAVLINSAKGQQAMDALKYKFDHFNEAELDRIIRGNSSLVFSPVKPDTRDQFFSKVRKGSKVLTAMQAFTDNKKVALLNFSSFTVHNYGACLVGYAMEKVVSRLGYEPQTVNFIPENKVYEATEKSVFNDFRNKFLHMTGVCKNKSELARHINPQFQRFIIGSDQIVRHPWHNDFVYYLDWLSGNKLALAYAASFGTSDLGMNKKQIRYAKECVKRFSAFSVRERSGAEIMKRHFGSNHTDVICDPTLLLEPSDYEQIIASSALKLPQNGYLAYYFLGHCPDILDGKNSGLPLVDAYHDRHGNYRSVGDWLKIIKYATAVLTDSFHGSAFSIIFKRQFVCLDSSDRGNDRLNTLGELTGVNRLTSSENYVEIAKMLIDKKIDYNSVQEQIGESRQKGIKFLKNALCLPLSYKENLLNLSLIQKLKNLILY